MNVPAGVLGALSLMAKGGSGQGGSPDDLTRLHQLAYGDEQKTGQGAGAAAYGAGRNVGALTKQGKASQAANQPAGQAGYEASRMAAFSSSMYIFSIIFLLYPCATSLSGC